MIAINEQTTEDIGSGPGAVERDDLALDYNSHVANSVEADRETLNYLGEQQRAEIVARDEWIERLEKQLAAEKVVADKYRDQLKRNEQVASWVIGQAFNEYGKQVAYTVNASLGGDDMILGNVTVELPDEFGPLSGRKVKVQVHSVYSVTLV